MPTRLTVVIILQYIHIIMYILKLVLYVNYILTEKMEKHPNYIRPKENTVTILFRQLGPASKLKWKEK